MSKSKLASVTPQINSSTTPVLSHCNVPYRWNLHVGRYVSVYFDRAQPAALWGEHRHPMLQIFFLGAGSECTIHWEEDGKWLCEEVNGPYLWIIGVGVAHKLEWRRDAFRMVLYIDPEFVRESGAPEIDRTALLTLDCASICDAQISVLLGEFERLEQPESPPAAVHIESLSTLAAVHILRAWCCLSADLPDCRSQMSSRNLVRVEQMIRSRLGEKILISEMAREVNMSESNFARIFTRSMGTAPGQYLINLRIEKA